MRTKRRVVIVMGLDRNDPDLLNPPPTGARNVRAMERSPWTTLATDADAEGGIAASPPRVPPVAGEAIVNDWMRS